VLVPFFPTSGAFAWLTGAGLVLSGAAELVLGWRSRTGGEASVLAKDWLITGAVAVGFGAALPFFAYLGAHALLGVAGAAAIITAVVLFIAALSYRHDALGSGAARP
jgi:drug/metabolite transporter (DMT)-like permease